MKDFLSCKAVTERNSQIIRNLEKAVNAVFLLAILHFCLLSTESGSRNRGPYQSHTDPNSLNITVGNLATVCLTIIRTHLMVSARVSEFDLACWLNRKVLVVALGVLERNRCPVSRSSF